MNTEASIQAVAAATHAARVLDDALTAQIKAAEHIRAALRDGRAPSGSDVAAVGDGAQATMSHMQSVRATHNLVGGGALQITRDALAARR